MNENEWNQDTSFTPATSRPGRSGMGVVGLSRPELGIGGALHLRPGSNAATDAERQGHTNRLIEMLWFGEPPFQEP